MRNIVASISYFRTVVYDLTQCGTEINLFYHKLTTVCFVVLNIRRIRMHCQENRGLLAFEPLKECSGFEGVHQDYSARDSFFALSPSNFSNGNKNTN